MAYALGRRVEPLDMPTVRSIVDDAEKDDYRMSALIMGVIMSDEFRMKDAALPPSQLNSETTTD